jgi:alpha-1,3-glucan synthase
MDGKSQVVDTNFVTAWNEMFVDNDTINPNTGHVDPKHMFGTSDLDVFRWPSLENRTQRGALTTFVTTLVMPGVPLVISASVPLRYSSELTFPLIVLLWRGVEPLPV